MTIAVYFAVEGYRLTSEPFGFYIVALIEGRVGIMMKNAGQFWKPVRLLAGNRQDLFCNFIAFGMLPL